MLIYRYHRPHYLIATAPSGQCQERRLRIDYEFYVKVRAKGDCTAVLTYTRKYV